MKLDKLDKVLLIGIASCTAVAIFSGGVLYGIHVSEADMLRIAKEGDAEIDRLIEKYNKLADKHNELVDKYKKLYQSFQFLRQNKVICKIVTNVS